MIVFNLVGALAITAWVWIGIMLVMDWAIRRWSARGIRFTGLCEPTDADPSKHPVELFRGQCRKDDIARGMFKEFDRSNQRRP